MLDGANANGHYDACPAYNIVNFMPFGAKLGNISASSQWVSVSSCNQDLRESYDLNLTKLLFSVWNSNEGSFDAYACVDSVNTVPLDAANQPPTPIVVGASSFDVSTLGTPNARFQVQGIAASVCPGSIASGLVAVYNTWVGIDGDIPRIDQDIGNTSQGAGSTPGFVLWDVGGGHPPPK